MDDGENKIRRDSCCQSTSQGDKLQRLQLCFLMILLALFYSVFWLHLNLVNKTTEARQEHAHHSMSRERKLLLEILLMECERIFPQDPSKAGLHLHPPLPRPPTKLRQSMPRGEAWHQHHSSPPSECVWGQFPQSKSSLFWGRVKNWTKLGLC